MEKFFITGGTGFLGSWLVEACLKRGIQVFLPLKKNRRMHAIQPKPSKYSLLELGRKCETFELDLTSPEEVTSELRNIQPTAIIHLAAAAVDVQLSQKYPLDTLKVSGNGTLNLLEAIKILELNIPVLNHSTDKVYSGNKPPFREDMFFPQKSIYEISKVTQDLLGTHYGKDYGLQLINIRCGNYFGAYDFDFNRIIPYAVRQLYKEESIHLRSHGKFTRDFLYIKDAVELNFLLIEKVRRNKGLCGEAFNFSVETDFSILELVRKVATFYTKDPDYPVTTSSESNNEIPDMRLDCSKANTRLSWRPRFNFDLGIRETIDGYNKVFQERPSLMT